MKTLEEVIETKDKYRMILEKTNEALLTYVEELKRLKRSIVELGAIARVEIQMSKKNSFSCFIEMLRINKETILRKAMKCKQL